MKILHWVDHYWPYIGGTERMIEELVKVQVAAGSEVAIVADCADSRLPAEDFHGGAVVRRWHFRKTLLTNDLPGLRRIVDEFLALKRSFRPDLVHIHLIGLSSWCFFLTQSTNRLPALVTLHMPPDSMGTVIPRLMTRRIHRSADRITAVSAAQLDRYRKEYPEIIPKSEVVHNGLSWPDEVPAPLPLDPPTLLCVGRVTRDKGFDVAIGAFRLIAAARPGARLIIAGDGPERSTLRQLCRDWGLRNVELPGWVAPERIPALINQACLVLMPSRWPEPFGLVAVQAAQMARPIVASDVGGIPEIVVEGETGRLVPPDSPEALAHAALSILGDPAGATRMGARARERAERDFSIAGCAGAYQRIYCELLAPRFVL